LKNAVFGQFFTSLRRCKSLILLKKKE